MGGLSDIALTVGRIDHSNSNGNGPKVASIIEFVESSWGIQLQLYPVQKVILKAHYGLELDDTVKFQIAKNWRQQEFWNFTEKEYLEYLYNEGRCNIGKVDHERTELVLAIGRRSGKCILGDSLVLTDRGVCRIEEIGDPEGDEVQPFETVVAQEGVRQRAVSRFFYNGGMRETRTLTTRCGYRLGGTNNHRVKVLTRTGMVDWKYLADLEVGDAVCIHRNTDLWASEPVGCAPFHIGAGPKELFPEYLDERWGRLLGYLAGGGIWNCRDGVEIAVERGETWEILKNLYTELFGNYSVTLDESRGDAGTIKFGNVGMRKFLYGLGFGFGTGRDVKMVPWAVLRSPRRVVRAFLRGLFEINGDVESGGRAVTFSTASERLAHEVQVLLLNLGIVSRRDSRIVRGETHRTLVIQGLRNRVAFAERVGFDSRKKMNSLLAGTGSADREDRAETIPHQHFWIRRLLDSVPKIRSCSRIRKILAGFVEADSIPIPLLTEVLSLAEKSGADAEVLNHFRHLIQLDYFFDPVVDIEDGVDQVFDLNVPDGESFVANGLTNHNTFLAAAIGAYETYKLILKGNPQKYYGLPDGKEIGIVSVATDRDQAGILYRDVSAYYTTCGFFTPYMASNTQSYARFQTPADIEQTGHHSENDRARASIRCTFKSCIAKGLRGPGNMIIILDELAHFTDGTQQSSAEVVYNAITPSTATFSQKDPNDSTKPIGDVEGRIISISSPLGRQGQFYKLFQAAMRGGRGSDDMLAIQAPTWEVNPTIPVSYYEKKFIKDPVVFSVEFGAQFTDRTKGWIERKEDLMACVDPARRPVTMAPARRPHFVGIDLGLVEDASAVAIGHIEQIDGESRIVLDYIDQIKAGVGDYEKYERLEFDDVAEWVYQLSRKFYMAQGLFDRWSGIAFEQALAKKGLHQLKSEHFTRNLISEIFKNFKDMMWDKRLVLYDWPKPADPRNGEHCEYIQELLELQAAFHSKYIITVAAPNIEGKHDDRADALVRMVWIASQHLGSRRYISKSSRSPVASTQKPSGADYRRALVKAKRSGSSPERQIQRHFRKRKI